MSKTVVPFEREAHAGLEASDWRLADFAEQGLATDAIVDWVQCAPPQSRRRRIDFIESYPVLLPMLVFQPENDFAHELLERIDGNESFAEAVAALIGNVAPDTVRFLEGKKLSLLSKQWIGDEHGLLLALDCLPEATRPQSDTDWEVFRFFQRSIRPLSWDTSGHFFRELCAPGYAVSRERWLDFTQGNLDRLADVDAYIGFLSEWARAFVRHGRRTKSNVVPFSRKKQNSSDTDSAVLNSMTRRTGYEIYDQARRWRRLYQDTLITEQLASNDPELLQWPGLWSEPFIANGIRVESSKGLLDALDHGQALYAEDPGCIESCTAGYTYLASLSDAEGRHRSTVQLWLSLSKRGTIEAFVSTHLSPDGSAASLREEEALEQAVRSLDLGEPQAGLNSLVSLQMARRERILQKMARLSAFEFKDMHNIMGTVLDPDQLSVLTATLG